jgi:hypothetical protein
VSQNFSFLAFKGEALGVHKFNFLVKTHKNESLNFGQMSLKMNFYLSHMKYEGSIGFVTGKLKIFNC